MSDSDFFFYVLECNDKTLYTGYTNNIKKRLSLHNSGKGSKYVRSRLPAVLKYWEKMSSKNEALKKEAQFKKLTRSAKLDYIKNNLEAEKNDSAYTD